MGSEKQRLAAAALVVLGALLWVRGLTVKPVRSRRPANPTAPAPLAPTLSSQGRGKMIEGAARPRSAEWGDSPFQIERRLSGPAQEASGGLVLSGILWDSKIPSAVVNNRLVAVGDTLDQWQVVEIRKKQVVLSDGKTTKVLTVQ